MAYGSSDVPATDFAITTVNVPDRLDLRDMDDRKQLEDHSMRNRFDASVLRPWLPRIVIIGVLAIIGLIAWQAIDTWKSSLAAAPLSDRLSAAFGVPVQVENTQLALTPSPRLILSKISLNNVVLNQVTIRLTTRHIAQAFQGSGFNWGEASVGPSSITMSQGHDLLQLLPRLDGAIAHGIGIVYFEDLQFPDQPWLKGSWNLSLERGSGGAFAKITAKQSSNKGYIQFVMTPQTPEIVGFEARASNWVLPFGLQTPIESVLAEGSASFAQVELTKFSLSGPFGEIHGSANAKSESGWQLSGNAVTDGLDLDAFLRQVAPPAKLSNDGDADVGTMGQGMASFNGRFSGQGPTLQDAVDDSVLVAPLQVRSAILNGINLGFIAMNPGANPESSGGTTRFVALDATLVASSKQTTIRDLHARAGALLALGEVSVSPSHELSGVLHVDLGTTRVLAPIRVRMHGTLAKPKYGR